MLQSYYPQLLALHGWLRWVVLIAGLTAFVAAASGWSGNKLATAGLRRLSILFVVTIDLQFVLGLLLYLGASPLTRMAFQNMSAAMKDHELRFFTVEHTTYMLLALIFAHLGAAVLRKAKSHLTKHRIAAMAWAVSLLLMLAGIPWWRPLLRFGA